MLCCWDWSHVMVHAPHLGEVCRNSCPSSATGISSFQASLNHQPPLFLLRTLTCQYILSRNIFNEPRRSGKNLQGPTTLSGDLPVICQPTPEPCSLLLSKSVHLVVYQKYSTTQSKSCKLFSPALLFCVYVMYAVSHCLFLGWVWLLVTMLLTSQLLHQVECYLLLCILRIPGLLLYSLPVLRWILNNNLPAKLFCLLADLFFRHSHAIFSQLCLPCSAPASSSAPILPS